MALDVGTSSGWAHHNLVSDVNDDAFTMGVWFYHTSSSGGGVVFNFATGISAGGTAYRIKAANASDKIQFVANWATAGRWESTTGGLSVNTWHHIGIQYDKSAEANNPVMFLDGASVGATETTTPIGPFQTGTINAVTFGRGTGGLFQMTDGLIAEATWHNVDDLSVDEMAYLPFAPWRVRPANLIAYWPFWNHERTGVDYVASERVQQANLTVEDSTAVAHHPPVRPFHVLPYGNGLPLFTGRTQRVGQLVNRPILASAVDGGLLV